MCFLTVVPNTYIINPRCVLYLWNSWLMREVGMTDTACHHINLLLFLWKYLPQFLLTWTPWQLLRFHPTTLFHANFFPSGFLLFMSIMLKWRKLLTTKMFEMGYVSAAPLFRDLACILAPVSRYLPTPLTVNHYRDVC